jgi:hypothetical protein
MGKINVGQNDVILASDTFISFQPGNTEKMVLRADGDLEVAKNVEAVGAVTGASSTVTGVVTGANFKLSADGAILDSSNNELVKLVKATSAVNELTVKNAAAGFDVELSATGGDTDIDMQLVAKGAGLILIGGSASGTATGGAATASAQRGYVTSEGLTTAGQASYTLTLTNTRIGASSLVFAGVENGTNTQGNPTVGRVKVTGAGTATIEIVNAHASQALNGTIIISFIVF